jgi:hypothetical protein
MNLQEDLSGYGPCDQIIIDPNIYLESLSENSPTHNIKGFDAGV